MNTLWNKLWCVILSLALLINLLPVSALAADTPTEQTVVQQWGEEPSAEGTEKTMQPLTTEVTEVTKAVIVREDISLRDEFSKHFEMSDGSYTATVYNEPVHQLVDGAWVEVDNSLQLSTSARGASQYKTVNGLTDVSFAQNFGNELVTMEQDAHSITWGVEATVDPMVTATFASSQHTDDLREPAQAEILPMDLSDVAAEEQKVFATKATSKIQYADALANDVDLEYTVLPSRIKESIILNSPQNISTYAVTVNTSDLFARLLDNREVEFYTEDGEIVFTMWAPYMYDSASELSEDVAVELTTLGKGQYTVTLTPDATWLNSSDRVYPIVIDPDVSVSRARTNIIDNTVMEGQGNQNRNLDRLYIGKKSGACVRAFLKYDVMPTIPADATITDATQTLYITSGTTTGSTAGAYIVTDGDWSADTITWANRPAARTTIHPSINHNNFSYYRFSCLSAVQKWYTGSTTGKNENYGITVRYTDETINDYNAIYSADYSVESSRPLLTISYQLPTDTITVREGSTYYLPHVNAAGTVIWSSSNTSIATVNTVGMVTGVKAGTATVTASVDGVLQKSYTVYVTILDGVYYIKSYMDLCLGTDGGIANGTYARIYSQATSGMAQLRQLWKVTYISRGYYTIRPLYKLDMLLWAPTYKTTITKNAAPDTFYDIPNTHRWTISYHTAGGGYALKLDGSNGLALKPDDPEVYQGLNATVRGYSASSISFKWTLEKVTGIANQVLLMDAATGASISGKTYYINRGETVTVEELGIVASFVCSYTLNQSVSWYSQNSSAISIDSATGTMTANIPDGISKIYAKHIHNGVEYSNTFTIVVNRQMTQFIDKMGELYDLAYSYEGGNQEKAYETLFNFIRGQKDIYTTSMWQGIAGNWNTIFVNYVKTHNISLYRYFAGESGNGDLMVSDTCSDGCIDVPHLAATLNRLFYTGETNFNGIPTLGIYDEKVDALSGWAGDCQTLIQDYYNNGNSNGTTIGVYDVFYPMIGSVAYSFGYSDIISDVDACNLHMLLSNQSITTGAQFRAVLYGYYSGTVGNVAVRRFTTWTGSYTEDTLKDKFFDYCNDYSTIIGIEWPILSNYTINDPQQEAFSQAFSDYFWAQREKE